MPVSERCRRGALADLGMDSLMGLELRLAVQQRLGADIPLTAMAGEQTISDIAARIATSLGAGGEGGVSRTDADLTHQHVTDGIEPARLKPLFEEIDRREADLGARS